MSDLELLRVVNFLTSTREPFGSMQRCVGFLGLGSMSLPTASHLAATSAGSVATSPAVIKVIVWASARARLQLPENRTWF